MCCVVVVFMMERKISMGLLVKPNTNPLELLRKLFWMAQAQKVVFQPPTQELYSSSSTKFNTNIVKHGHRSS